MIALLYVFLGIVAIVVILGLIAPKTYHVHRSTEIAKSKQEVFDYLRSLKNMDEWSPWAKRDPDMKKKFTGTDGEVGSISYWNGNKDVGEGEQEIKKLIESDRIESELRFLKPWKSTSDCYFELAEADGGNTKVTWGFSGNNKFPMSIFSLFVSMDKMVGKDFEEGMENLKSIMES